MCVNYASTDLRGIIPPLSHAPTAHGARGELVVNTLVNAHPFYALSLLLNILLRVGH